MKKLLIILFVISFSFAKGQQAPVRKPGIILLIHGMFMNNECWTEWISYYESKGYKCIAPSWPYHNKPVQELRDEHPNRQLGQLTLDTVLLFYEKIIKSLDEPPILIGHSMGGLLVQLLLNKGYGANGIAISASVPHGIKSYYWSTYKSNRSIANPLYGDAPYCMPFHRFQYAFVNGLPLERQKEMYYKFSVPESRNIARSSSRVGKIDYDEKQQPLLFIAGEKDHIIPPNLSKKVFEEYAVSKSQVDFKVFPGRNHFIIRQDNWKEVADYILDWVHKTDLIIATSK